MDYNKDASTTRDFFAKVQNKLHFAIHGHTAELIMQRADSTKAHMWLTCWESGIQGKIMNSDIVIAKNYLIPDELAASGRIVNAYLDLNEHPARRRIPISI